MASVVAKTPRVDGFGMRTRVLPAGLVVAPAAVAVVALSWGPTKWWGTILGVLASCGGVWFAEQFARSAGKRLEQALWTSWGGPPSTTKLRHGSANNPVVLARRHRQLQELTRETLPSAAQEAADPPSADDIYELAGGVLREATRDHKRFPLVYAELCNYNFRRNLLGMRRLGLSVSCGSLGASLLALGFALEGSNGRLSVRAAVVVAGISLTCVALWWRTVSDRWVKEAADAYAENLLAAAEHLVGSPPTHEDSRPATQGRKHRS